MTKFLAKAQAIIEANAEVTPESISKEDKQTIDLVLSQLAAKKRQLKELDQSILAAITTEQNLEDEVTDSEMYHFNLTERFTALKKFSSASAQALPIDQNSDNTGEQVVPQDNIQKTADHTTQPENIEQESLLDHMAPTGGVSGSLSHTHMLYAMWVSLWVSL